MKITDMNLICLEECFEHLELKDLLNVADTNKRLRKAAEFVFFQKYSKRCVHFQASKASFTDDSLLDLETESQISLIGDVKTSLQILRCFGHLIKDVVFHSIGSWGGNLHGEQCVFDQLNEYCADSLVKISICTLIDSPENKRVMFTIKPFPRAEKVEISDCNLVAKGEQLGTLFPKMKTLIYRHNENDSSALINRYPHLDDLSINMTEHTTSILHLNPQLKKLKLCGRNDNLCDENTLRNSIESLQNLEEFIFSVQFSNFIGNKIKLKNVKNFEVRRFKDEQKFPFLFDQLESFSIEHTAITSNVYDFIDQHSTINNLSISSTTTEHINISRISKALPSLIKMNVALNMDHNPFFAKDLLCSVSNFKSLKKFTFLGIHFRTVPFYNELQALVDKHSLTQQWRISIEYQRYITFFDLERIDHQTSQ